MISEHTVRSYFAQAHARGWRVAGGSLQDGWHAVYLGRLRNYEAYLDVADQWVYLQCPVLRAPARPACEGALHRFLLRTNDRMFLGKFTIIEPHAGEPHQDWIALTVECSTDHFDAAAFRLMTDAVATYAEDYVREIEVLAYDEELARTLEDKPDGAIRIQTVAGIR